MTFDPQNNIEPPPVFRHLVSQVLPETFDPLTASFDDISFLVNQNIGDSSTEGFFVTSCLSKLRSLFCVKIQRILFMLLLSNNNENHLWKKCSSSCSFKKKKKQKQKNMKETNLQCKQTIRKQKADPSPMKNVVSLRRIWPLNLYRG